MKSLGNDKIYQKAALADLTGIGQAVKIVRSAEQGRGIFLPLTD